MKKSIIITGVSRGCGRVLAERWMREGHAVYGCSRSPQAIAALQERSKVPDAFQVVDVSSADEVNAWTQSLPAPDLLVNNAAIMNRNAPLWEIGDEEFNQLLRSCWGDEAAAFPSPEQWVDQAAPFLLALSATDNGHSLSV